MNISTNPTLLRKDKEKKKVHPNSVLSFPINQIPHPLTGLLAPSRLTAAVGVPLMYGLD